MDKEVKKSMQKNQAVQLKSKKAIIIVGRMGTGKSAIVNSLIIPKSGLITSEIKTQLVQEKADLKSVTTQCAMRQIHPSHELLKESSEKLYVFDTPGLDSQSAPSLVSEQIDNSIIEQKCDIVAIVYVVNLGQLRQVGADNQSKIKQFLKVLKIKKDFKNNLILFVLSKWDEICMNKKKDDIANLQNQFYQLLRNLEIPHPQQQTIKWANQRSMDEDNIEYFKLKKDGVRILEQQWSRLRSNIRRCEFIPFILQDHIKNVTEFWEKLKNRILSQIDNQNIKYEKQPSAIYYDLKIKLREWDILKDEGNVIEVFLKIPVFNIIFLLYSIGSWVRHKDKKLAQGLQNKPTLTSAQKLVQSKLIGHISTKLKSIIIISLLKNIIVKDNTLIFDQVGKALKIPKLLVFYESQFAGCLQGTDKMKVPIAFIYTERLKERIQVKFSFQKDQRKAIQYEQSMVEKFKGQNEKSMKILIPQKTIFFVKEKQEFFTIRLKVFCRLPEQSSYCSLVKDLCVEMFGDYK